MRLTKNKFQLALVLGWFIFTYLAFRYFSFHQLKEFDPSLQLQDVNTVDITKRIMDSGIDISKGNLVINFYQNECPCNKYTNRHVNELKRKSLKYKFDFYNINTINSKVVPSTPSVAIIGSEGTLVYLGPYGEGLECSQTNGYAQTILDNYMKGFSADLIVSSANGCYCAT